MNNEHTTKSPLDDLYGDFDNFDLGLTVERYKNECKLLHDRLKDRDQDVEKLANALVEMKSVNQNLTNNISSLFMTAKAEIERKNNIIAELRRDRDNIAFRRQGHTVQQIKTIKQETHNSSEVVTERKENNVPQQPQERISNINIKEEQKQSENIKVELPTNQDELDKLKQILRRDDDHSDHPEYTENHFQRYNENRNRYKQNREEQDYHEDRYNTHYSHMGKFRDDRDAWDDRRRDRSTYRRNEYDRYDDWRRRDNTDNVFSRRYDSRKLNPFETCQSDTSEPRDSCKYGNREPRERSKSRNREPGERSKSGNRAPRERSKSRNREPRERSNSRNREPRERSKSRNREPGERNKSGNRVPRERSKSRNREPYERSKSGIRAPRERGRSRNREPYERSKSSNQAYGEGDRSRNKEFRERSTSGNRAPRERGRSRNRKPRERNKSDNREPLERSNLDNGEFFIRNKSDNREPQFDEQEDVDDIKEPKIYHKNKKMLKAVNKLEEEMSKAEDNYNSIIKEKRPKSAKKKKKEKKLKEKEGKNKKGKKVKKQKEENEKEETPIKIKENINNKNTYFFQQIDSVLDSVMKDMNLNSKNMESIKPEKEEHCEDLESIVSEENFSFIESKCTSPVKVNNKNLKNKIRPDVIDEVVQNEVNNGDICDADKNKSKSKRKRKKVDVEDDSIDTQNDEYKKSPMKNNKSTKKKIKKGDEEMKEQNESNIDTIKINKWKQQEHQLLQDIFGDDSLDILNEDEDIKQFKILVESNKKTITNSNHDEGKHNKSKNNVSKDDNDCVKMFEQIFKESLNNNHELLSDTCVDGRKKTKRKKTHEQSVEDETSLENKKQLSNSTENIIENKKEVTDKKKADKSAVNKLMSKEKISSGKNKETLIDNTCPQLQTNCKDNELKPKKQKLSKENIQNNSPDHNLPEKSPVDVTEIHKKSEIKKTSTVVSTELNNSSTKKSKKNKLIPNPATIESAVDTIKVNIEHKQLKSKIDTISTKSDSKNNSSKPNSIETEIDVGIPEKNNQEVNKICSTDNVNITEQAVISNEPLSTICDIETKKLKENLENKIIIVSNVQLTPSTIKYEQKLEVTHASNENVETIKQLKNNNTIVDINNKTKETLKYESVEISQSKTEQYSSKATTTIHQNEKNIETSKSVSKKNRLLERYASEEIQTQNKHQSVNIKQNHESLLTGELTTETIKHNLINNINNEIVNKRNYEDTLSETTKDSQQSNPPKKRKVDITLLNDIDINTTNKQECNKTKKSPAKKNTEQPKRRSERLNSKEIKEKTAELINNKTNINIKRRSDECLIQNTVNVEELNQKTSKSVNETRKIKSKSPLNDINEISVNSLRKSNETQTFKQPQDGKHLVKDSDKNEINYKSPVSKKDVDTENRTNLSSEVTENSVVSPSDNNSALQTKPRKRITPTPVKDTPISFRNILEKNNTSKLFSKSVTMETQYAEMGDIPILHLEEISFSNMEEGTQRTFDKNIMKLLDCMNVSNLDCDLSKLNDTNMSQDLLTFENAIKTVETPALIGHNTATCITSKEIIKTPPEQKLPQIVTSTPDINKRATVVTLTPDINKTPLQQSLPTIGTSTPDINKTPQQPSLPTIVTSTPDKNKTPQQSLPTIVTSIPNVNNNNKRIPVTTPDLNQENRNRTAISNAEEKSSQISSNIGDDVAISIDINSKKNINCNEAVDSQTKVQMSSKNVSTPARFRRRCRIIAIRRQ